MFNKDNYESSHFQSCLHLSRSSAAILLVLVLEQRKTVSSVGAPSNYTWSLSSLLVQGLIAAECLLHTLEVELQIHPKEAWLSRQKPIACLKNFCCFLSLRVWASKWGLFISGYVSWESLVLSKYVAESESLGNTESAKRNCVHKETGKTGGHFMGFKRIYNYSNPPLKKTPTKPHIGNKTIPVWSIFQIYKYYVYNKCLHMCVHIYTHACIERKIKK